MKAGYRYDAKICFRCGRLVHYNWYIRHRRSGCVLGRVTAPDNKEIKLTRTGLADSEVDSPDVPDAVPSDV